MLKINIGGMAAVLLIVAAFIVVTPSAVNAAAQSAVTVIVDGKKIDCSPAPINEGGRVLVPMRSVFESLGYTVEYDDYFKLAKARMTTPDGSKRNVSLSTVKLSMAVWEIKTTISPVTDASDRVEFIIPLDPKNAPIKNVGGRILLPMGIIADALGCDVKWDNATKTATISTAGATITPPTNWVDAIEKHYAKYAPDQLTAKQSWLDEEAENQRILSGAINPQAQSGTANANGDKQNDGKGGKIYSVFSERYNKTFEYTFTKPAKATAAPKIGTVPANILIDEGIPLTAYPDPNNKGQWIFNRTEAYTWAGSAVVGGCNWYAGGRFKEVYGIPFLCFDKFLGTEKYLDFADGYDEFLAIRDKHDVRDNSIVVYGKGQYNSGHVAFVEYVERDASGKPVTIYFTEANADNPTGEYRHGIDGAVQKLSIADFLNRSKPTLGYIIPNPDFYRD